MMICSVEGGAQCETKQVKLDGGKAKCKLRAAENKPVRNEKTFNLILNRFQFRCSYEWCRWTEVVVRRLGCPSSSSLSRESLETRSLQRSGGKLLSLRLNRNEPRS